MENLVTILIVLAVAFCIFLLCRELNCWYLKINERRDLLKSIVENQEAILDLLEEQAAGKQEGTKQNGKKTVVSETGKQKIPVVKEESFHVGQKVTTKVEKFGLPAGTVVRVDQVGDKVLTCSYEMREVGMYFFDEVEE